MARLPYALIEIMMVVLFISALRFAWRSGGTRALLELLSAVPYGLLLEQGDITIFGSYAYSQLFFIKLGAVPVAIALAWALIITSCMYISDALGIPARVAPVTDATLAIILDLSFDAIAIRQGLWHWNIPLDAGYFGVPAGNFFAWLFVAFSFSAWTRLVRHWLASHVVGPTPRSDSRLPDPASPSCSVRGVVPGPRCGVPRLLGNVGSLCADRRGPTLASKAGAVQALADAPSAQISDARLLPRRGHPSGHIPPGALSVGHVAGHAGC